MTDRLEQARIHALENAPTLRDYFAAAALQGLIAFGKRYFQSDNTWNFQDLYAVIAYEYADSMLKAREQK